MLLLVDLVKLCGIMVMVLEVQIDCCIEELCGMCGQLFGFVLCLCSDWVDYCFIICLQGGNLMYG